VFAYSLADGSDIRGKALNARKGYQAASDLMIAQGALWMCGAGATPSSYDLKTGEPIKTIPQKLSKPMGHDRCFRNFITERFFINSKTGGPDCLDLEDDTEYPAPFARATCSMGPLPCNGLIYNGPWACQCHLPVALHNFNAYYTDEDSLPTKGQVVRVERSVRLEKGPAYGTSGKAMALAGGTVFVAGAPLTFEPDDLGGTYQGKHGGVLWAASVDDGSKIAEYTLDTLPAWDGMAAAYGKLYIVNKDGGVECWGR
jgi:hypothetical protein